MSIRALSITLIGIAILIMALHVSEYLRYAIASVYYRYEIFDAEGIVWQQAMLIPGPRMYGDITQYPFIVFHYPPVYHLLSRALSLLGCTPLFAGRALSLAATLFCAATISRLTSRLLGPDTGRLAAVLGCAAAGLVYFCFFPIVLTSTLMRVDMLAIAFSLLGLLCFTAPRMDSWRPYAGMALFVLAVFTKQTSIAAPLAAMAVTALIAPRQAAKLVGFGVVLGLAPLSILMWMTHGGFLRHLVLYNINRFSLGLFWIQLRGQAPHLVFVLLALAGLVLWWRRFPPNARVGSLLDWRDVLARDNRARAMAMITLYLAVSTVTLAGLGKSGAGLSYFDEWIGILSILIGVLVAMIASPGAASGMFGNSPTAPLLRLLLPVFLIVQVSSLPAKGKLDFTDPVQARESDELIDRIAHAEKPVLSADMVMLMLAGKPVPWEPAIFNELASLGRWDETLITRMIEAHEFAFVVTRGPPNFSPAVARAVSEAYPRVEDIAQHTVHLPPP